MKRIVAAPIVAALLGAAALLATPTPAGAWGEHQFSNRNCLSWVSSWSTGGYSGYAETRITSGSCTPYAKVRTASGGGSFWFGGTPGGIVGVNWTGNASNVPVGGSHKHCSTCGWNNT